MTDRQQRGYTIVEIGFVIMASAILFYSLAAGFFKLKRDAEANDAREVIEIIKESIIDYAAKHATASYTVLNKDAQNITLYWRTPANRPYLPCPDVTGDGLEDRHPLPTVEINMEIILEVEKGKVEGFSEYGGYCVANRGMVPWKTLETPPADPWGNRYSYRVGENFSNSIAGFDGATRSSDIYSSRPLRLITLNGTRVGLQQTKPPGDSREVTVAVVLGALSSQLELESARHPSVICDRAPCGAPGVSLVAGHIATSEVTVRGGEYDVLAPIYAEMSDENVIEGVPVVILSHGGNGHGAFLGNNQDSQLYCRPFPLTDGYYADEKQNAYRSFALGTRCPPVTTAKIVGNIQNLLPHGFVARPAATLPGGGGEGRVFDDVVGWMSAEEIVNELRARNAISNERLPPVGLEGEP